MSLEKSTQKHGDNSLAVIAAEALLATPGGLSEAKRAEVQATLGSATADTGMALRTLLSDRLHFTLKRAFADYCQFAFPRRNERPSDIEERLQTAYAAVVTPDVDSVGLLLATTLHDFTLYVSNPDTERELRGFNATPAGGLQDWQYASGDVAGMTTQELRELSGQYGQFFDSIASGNCAAAHDALRSLLSADISSELTQLARNPRAMYERILTEQVVRGVQIRKADEWLIAATDRPDTTASDRAQSEEVFLTRARQTPAVLVQQILRRHHARVTAPPPTTDIFLPHYVKGGQMLGLPDFDVPVRLLQSMTKAERLNLAAAFSAHVPADAKEQQYCAVLARSLAAFEANVDANHGEYRYTHNPFAVVDARRIALERDAGKTPAAPKRKWIDYVAPTFTEQDTWNHAKAWLDTLGYIPQSLYRDAKQPENVSEKFKTTASFTHLAAFHAFLVQCYEETNNQQGIAGASSLGGNRILNARAQLLDTLIVSGVAKEQSTGRVTVDTNGLFLNLERRKNAKEVQARLAAHIPFVFVTDQALSALLEQGWLNPEQADEVRLQRARAQQDDEKVQLYDTRKAVVIAGQLEDGSVDGPFAALARHITDPNLHAALKRVLQADPQKPLHLPGLTVRKALEQKPEKEVVTTVQRLLQFAALLQSSLGPSPNLSDPRQYDVQKAIIEPLFASLSESGPGRDVGLFWQYVGRSRGQRQRLRIGVRSQPAWSILLDSGKITPRTRENIGRFAMHVEEDISVE